MKIKGCLLVRPPMLNAKSSENFLSRPKLGKFWRFWGLGVRGYKKLLFLLQKARHLSHFASKSVEGCDLQVRGKKSESHRGSHRKDMSPLTHGLNYRSACDAVKMMKYGLVMTPTPCIHARVRPCAPKETPKFY